MFLFSFFLLSLFPLILPPLSSEPGSPVLVCVCDRSHNLHNSVIHVMPCVRRYKSFLLAYEVQKGLTSRPHRIGATSCRKACLVRVCGACLICTDNCDVASVCLDSAERCASEMISISSAVVLVDQRWVRSIRCCNLRQFDATMKCTPCVHGALLFHGMGVE